MLLTDRELRAEAERRATRQAAGLPFHETPEEGTARLAEEDSRTEKAIQRDVYKLFRAHGCEVYWMSQARTTRQTAGVPDLIVFNQRARRMWYFECKTPRGGPSPGQTYFRELCERCGLDYVIGGLAAAQGQLVKIGAAYRDSSGSLEPRL